MKCFVSAIGSTALALTLAATAQAAELAQATQVTAPAAAGQQGTNTPFNADHEAKGAHYSVVMERIDVAEPKVIGTVQLQDTPDGLRVTPALEGLPPGKRGFHVHQNGKCSPRLGEQGDPGSDAGPHYDPEESGTHAGPHGEGHRGDLPQLVVDDNGRATQELLAPRLKLADVTGRALIIHEGGDNFADEPKPLGGGGKRIACGIIRN